MDRQARITQINAELSAYREKMAPLQEERERLESEQNREDWPAGPFTLHYMRYGSEQTEEFDTPLEAVQTAISIEDHGEGSIERIVDSRGETIYDLRRAPWQRKDESYPEFPKDAYV